MRKKQKYLIAGAVIAVLLAVTVFFWKNWGETLPFFTNEKNPSSPTSHLSPPTSNVQNGVYRNERFAFSLSIPDGFKVTENNPDEFTTLVLAETASGKILGFQIFIMPFDEPGPINKERILIDMPDAIIDEPQNISINGIDAFLFFGKDEDIGRTREVWFANDGYLYQVSSYASFDEELSKIMATFKFTNR